MATNVIETDRLRKVYRVLEGKRGFLGAMVNLVSRDYRIIEAVKGLDLTIEGGSICGIIGPNGAGKSTTIKLLTGILVPDAGSVRVLGVDPSKDRSRNAMNIAVVFGQRTKLWWDLPCMESFGLHRDMYRIPIEAYESRIAEFSELLGIDEFWRTPVRQLSLGQRMRAEISLSMLHDPSVVFLDEPSIGLDAIAKERVRRFILERNRSNGTTFVITSHDMADIERLCSRVLIIDEGSVLFDGTIAGIIDRFGAQRILTVEFRVEPDDLDLPFGSVVEDRGVVKSIGFSRSEGSSIDLITHLAGRCEIADVTMKDAEIESVIRSIYEHRTGKQ
jgi:ABC-2 type transport system ATP-binding protein